MFQKLKQCLNKCFLKYINKYFWKKEQIPPVSCHRGWENIAGLPFVRNIKLFEGSKIKTGKTHTVQSDLHGNFRKSEIEYPEDYIFFIENARVCGTEGLVITPENKVIDKVNIIHDHIGPISGHEIFSRFKLPEVMEVDGSVAVLTSLWPDFYYHWMTDILPKFHMLDLASIKPDYYVLNSGDKKFQEFTLEKLGVPKEKIIKTHKNLHLKPEKLILPKIPGFTGHDPEWAVDFLREKFFDSSISFDSPERIYISRNRAFSRRFVNNDEVENLIKKHGFEEVFIENYNVCEQAHIFNRAKAVFAPHGGGLTNVIFSKEGTKVIEVCSPKMPIPCYWALSNMRGLEYYHITADFPKKKIKKDGFKYTSQDIILDTKILEKTLKMALN